MFFLIERPSGKSSVFFFLGYAEIAGVVFVGGWGIVKGEVLGKSIHTIS